MRIVITSVNYADYLCYTLPRWREAFPDAKFRIVTSLKDEQTRFVADGDAFSTDAFFRDGALFNKAAALDEAMRDFQNGEIVVKIDADVIPHGTLPTEIEHNTIYGCARYDESGKLLKFHSRKNPNPTPEQCARRCIGFFQMFKYRRGRIFGSYPDASRYDIDFRRKFSRRVALPDFYVTHIGPMSKRNWKGRIFPPLER